MIAAAWHWWITGLAGWLPDESGDPALVPEALLFRLDLPLSPPFRVRDVEAALAERAPLERRRLLVAWRVADEGARVAMAERARTEAWRAQEAPGAMLVAAIDGEHIPLAPPPLTPERRRAIGAALGLVATIPVSVAAGAWLLAPAPAPPPAALPPAAQAFFAPPLTTTLAALAEVLPPGATLHALTVTAGGATEIEIDAPDPDILRPALAAAPALRGFHEIGQSRAQDLGLRLRWRRERA